MNEEELESVIKQLDELSREHGSYHFIKHSIDSYVQLCLVRFLQNDPMTFKKFVERFEVRIGAWHFYADTFREFFVSLKRYGIIQKESKSKVFSVTKKGNRYIDINKELSIEYIMEFVRNGNKGIMMRPYYFDRMEVKGY